MNAYTTRGQARIQPYDLATILRTSTGSYTAAVSLAGLERQRGYQAVVEVEWQLTHNGSEPPADTSLVFALRQTVGAALVRAGEHLAGVPRSTVSPEMTRGGST